MRSNTHLSLLEFIEWAGGDPWLFAQIQREKNRIKDQPQRVTIEHPWQMEPKPNSGDRAGVMSRQAIAMAIANAERLFARWTNRHPVPVCIENEHHPYPNRRVLNYTHTPLLKPDFQWYQEGGVCVLSANENAIGLARGSDPTPDEIFTATVGIPDDTTADQVRVFIREGDAGYTGLPELKHEIRPLTVTINSSGGSGNWVASISGPAYLFVRPSFYEGDEPDPLDHKLATYIDAISVRVETVDPCQQGEFVFIGGDCGDVPCGETTSALCQSHHRKKHSDWVRPLNLECNDDDELVRYPLQQYPDGVRLNYVAGKPRVEQRRMDPAIREIICMMTAALVPCEMEMDCETCKNHKLSYYREIPKVEIENPRLMATGTITGGRQQVMVPSHVQTALGGYDPYRGLTQAYQYLSEAGLLARTGGILL